MKYSPDCNAARSPPVSRNAMLPTNWGRGSTAVLVPSKRLIAGAWMSTHQSVCVRSSHSGHSPSRSWESTTRSTAKLISFRILTMKIAEWSLHFYRLPYVRDIQWVYAAESSGDYALLRIVADNGAVGIAEGVIKPTRTGYSPRSLGVVLEDVILPQLRK